MLCLGCTYKIIFSYLLVLLLLFTKTQTKGTESPEVVLKIVICNLIFSDLVSVCRPVESSLCIFQSGLVFV